MGTDNARPAGRIGVGTDERVREHVADAVVGEALVEAVVGGVVGDGEAVEIVVGVGPALTGLAAGDGRDAAGGIAAVDEVEMVGDAERAGRMDLGEPAAGRSR